MTKRLTYLVWAVTAVLTVSSCATIPSNSVNTVERKGSVSATRNPEDSQRGRSRLAVAGGSDVPFTGSVAASASAASSVQAKLVDGANYVVGKETLNINGQSFPIDCSGVVRAIYWYAGIDLTAEFPKYTGNGVKRIHDILEDKDLLYETQVPSPGDIVFWDNTYDRNGDGKWNDLFTHCGVILSADRKGNIEYVHANYREGIVVEHMNLKNPDIYTREYKGETITINSPMRMRGSPNGKGWLSSHLMRVFGMGYDLPD